MGELLGFLGSFAPFVITIVVFILVLKLLSVPFKWIWKLILNSIIGAIAIWVVNVLGGAIGLGIHIDINIVTSIIVGIFGLIGVIFIIIYDKFIK